jgi:hypothetical protein
VWEIRRAHLARDDPKRLDNARLRDLIMRVLSRLKMNHPKPETVLKQIVGWNAEAGLPPNANRRRHWNKRDGRTYFRA